jgi:microcystin-dependent protein
MDAYIGEIRMFGGTFAPKGWAFCEGQLMAISQNTALFSIIGVMYGGDGKVTFGLPDLRGSVPINQGAGPGLTPRSVGEMGGSPAVTLLTENMPAHNHLAMGSSGKGTSRSPADAIWSQFSTGTRPPEPTNLYAPSADVTMAADALVTAGQNMPHNNLQPYLPVRFIICLSGIFPPRP